MAEESAAPVQQPEKSPDPSPAQTTKKARKEDYRWCKMYYDPGSSDVQNFYFTHLDTAESVWELPEDYYWIWDSALENYTFSGTEAFPSDESSTPTKSKSTEPPADYQGYNPKIHGSYDPNAPYAQYHNRLRQQEAAQEEGRDPQAAQPTADYSAVGTFNRFTGAYQSADKNAERHNDYNKSGRQMSAFFDVDAAANSHDGRSLKDERRAKKLSKKEIKELNAKRKEKKEQKRLAWLKS